ncbi:MAG: glycerol-3-phosphate 1-O-acyltransferase PlsY [Alphaproteobacteria bacterium]|nr:glycerol-3-phosphate 1-O-acyltransferase PlsY [Alphaproteobacteria bacterium]
MPISLTLILCAIGGYLLGSIPFGLVLTRMCGLGDIRKIGSGNIGATNVLRTGRKDLALLTVILDASKAGIAAFLAEKLVNTSDISILGIFTQTNILAGLIAGTCGVLGHNFPIWLKFKGGKGVASTFGFILATVPQIAILALITWLTVAIISRYSSLAAITASVLTPLYAFFLTEPIYCIFYTAIAALVLYRHHANISRLLKGEESKISLKKK